MPATSTPIAIPDLSRAPAGFIEWFEVMFDRAPDAAHTEDLRLWWAWEHGHTTGQYAALVAEREGRS